MKNISQVIYRLCRSRGLPIHYFTVSSESGADAITGLKDLSYSITLIPRAIILNDRDYRSFVYDLAYISANKDFTTGGYFDPSDRVCFFDARNLPRKPRNGDYIYYNGLTYLIMEVVMLEGTYYRLKLKNIRGGTNLHIITNHSGIIFESSCYCVLADRLELTATNTLTLTNEVKEST